MHDPRITIQGIPDWHTWMRAAARRARLSVVGLIDQALVEYAERRGWSPPPHRTKSQEEGE